MESYANNQEVSENDPVAVNIRLDKEINDRVERFAQETVRTKSHAIKFLVLQGFEHLAEKEGVA